MQFYGLNVTQRIHDEVICGVSFFGVGFNVRYVAVIARLRGSKISYSFCTTCFSMFLWARVLSFSVYQVGARTVYFFRRGQLTYGYRIFSSDREVHMLVTLDSVDFLDQRIILGLDDIILNWRSSWPK